MNEMISWARNEIKLAMKETVEDCYSSQETGEKAPNIFDEYHHLECYQKALNAYEQIIPNVEHYVSPYFTKSILDSLIDGKPLTELKGTEDEWIKLGGDDIKYPSQKELIKQVTAVYQNKRCYSLFKYVYADGHFVYDDIDRVQCVKKRDDGTLSIPHHMDLISDIVNDMYPIVFPYKPNSKSYTAIIKEYSSDLNNGDFDTLFFIELQKPNGTTEHIGRYFIEDEENKECGWHETSWSDFKERVDRYYDIYYTDFEKEKIMEDKNDSD